MYLVDVTKSITLIPYLPVYNTAGHFKKARPRPNLSTNMAPILVAVPEKGLIDVCFTNPSKTESGRIW